MKFGQDIISNRRIEPEVGLPAKCQSCGELLIAKCGDIRVHHWAHKGKKHCDIWWEPETQWHRTWKNLFPADWQEIIKFDNTTGEKHIADVYNGSKDVVLEFQNSPIEKQEVISRENFYKRMIWVLNAQKFQLSISQLQDILRYSPTIQGEISIGIKRHEREIQEKIFDKNIDLELELKRLELKLSRRQINEEDASKKRADILKRKLKNSEDTKKETPFVLSSDVPYYRNMLVQRFTMALYSKKNHKLDKEDHYVYYEWTRKPKAWNYATLPIFLDFGNSLIWLISSFLAKRVRKEVFLRKYSEQNKFSFT